MSVGIAAYGCHFPVARLPAEALAKAWGRAPAGLRGKRVAGLDEDALTLALAAASSDAVAGPVDMLALASTSLPYRRRVQAGLLARGRGVEGVLEVLECTTSSRAGTEALIAASRAVAAGRRGARDEAERPPADGFRALLVASEVAAGPADGGTDAPAGAGAAALVLEPGGRVASVEASATWVDEDPGLDFVLAGEDVRRDIAVDDYAVDVYTGAVRGAVQAVLEKVSRPLSEYRFVALAHPSPRKAGKAARALGLEAEQWQAARAFPETGDVGAAGALIELVAVLDAATPGDRILLVSYGGGSAADAVSLEAGPEAGGERLSRALAGATEIDYVTYLKLRGEV